MIEMISSTQHPLIKHVVKIRENRSFRYLKKQVLVSGRKMVLEVNQSQPAHLLFLNETASLPQNLHFEQMVRISERVMKKITGLECPEELAAVYPLPLGKDLSNCQNLIVLDQINDPGNLGTLIRTALAFGWEGIFFFGNCCDPFNEKALRASKGAIFRIPFQYLSLEETERLAKWNLAGADIHGSPPEKINAKEKLALVIGSESHGISPKIWEHLQEKISLPMPGDMESLNAGVAGGILMYLFRPEKKKKMREL